MKLLIQRLCNLGLIQYVLPSLPFSLPSAKTYYLQYIFDLDLYWSPGAPPPPQYMEWIWGLNPLQSSLIRSLLYLYTVITASGAVKVSWLQAGQLGSIIITVRCKCWVVIAVKYRAQSISQSIDYRCISIISLLVRLQA